MALCVGPWLGGEIREEEAPWNVSGEVQDRMGAHVREVHNEVLSRVKPASCRSVTNHLVYEITINGIPARAMLDSGASHSFVNEHWIQ